MKGIAVFSGKNCRNRVPTVSDLGRARRSHRAVRSRTSTRAVNIDTRMPMLIVTAKPLIAPTPTKSRISIFRSVVTLESTIVVMARR